MVRNSVAVDTPIGKIGVTRAVTFQCIRNACSSEIRGWQLARPPLCCSETTAIMPALDPELRAILQRAASEPDPEVRNQLLLSAKERSIRHAIQQFNEAQKAGELVVLRGKSRRAKKGDA